MNEVDDLKAILDQSVTGLLVTNDAGQVLHANLAAADLLGVPKRELVGNRLPHRCQPQQTSSDQAVRGYCPDAGDRHLLFSHKRIQWHDKPAHLVCINAADWLRPDQPPASTDKDRDMAIMRLADAAIEGASRNRLRNLAAEIIRDHLRVDLSAVLEYEADNDTIGAMTGVGWDEAHVDGNAPPTGPGARLHAVLNTDQPVVVADWSRETRFVRDRILGAHGVASSMNAAIPHAGTKNSRPWGVLGAYCTQPRTFPFRDIHYLQRVAYILGYALQYAHLLLRERENSMLVRAAGRVARIGGWEINFDADQTIWSDETCAMHGLPARRTVMTLAQAAGYTDQKSGLVARQAMNRLTGNGEPFDLELRIITAQDEYVWVRAIGEPVYGECGRITGAVGSIQDITQSRNARAEMDFLALHDTLTQLPNRRLLEDRLLQAIRHCKHSGKKAALMLLDLDDFKALNDTLGHIKGDRVLQQIANRLLALQRNGDTVSRFGGDEFVLVVCDLDEDIDTAADQAEAIGNEVLAALREPFRLGDSEYLSTQSLGITLIGFPNDDCAELLKQADLIMYTAKNRGGNQVCVYEPAIQQEFEARALLEREMRHGLSHGQFHTYYQAQVDVNQRIVGAETLVRWQHPRLGLVAPFKFIAIAEKSGLIHPLGQLMLQKACLQLARWTQSRATDALTLSVNVSARQFHHHAFAADLERILERSGAPPCRLVLELTETSLLENMDDTINTMQALGQLGITFSLDDFGTGYSSLYYLKHLPLTQLKIDKSFVHGVHESASDRTIVRTILALAGAMDLDVVAEGVESDKERQFLVDEGCRVFQGFLFGRPQPVRELEASCHDQEHSRGI